MKLSLGQRGGFGLQKVWPQQYNREKGHNPSELIWFFQDSTYGDWLFIAFCSFYALFARDPASSYPKPER